MKICTLYCYKMASDSEISSDCIDGYITKVSEAHVDYLKRRVANYLLEAKNMSAEIHHAPGQPARLYFTEGPSSGMIVFYILKVAQAESQ